MRLFVVHLLAGAASFVLGSPIDTDAAEFSRAILEGRQTASGCRYYASPTCCMPTICICTNNWIYHVNLDAMNRGQHGCDPPWGFIATSRSGFAGYCCREAPDGHLETEDGETVDVAAGFVSDVEAIEAA